MKEATLSTSGLTDVTEFNYKALDGNMFVEINTVQKASISKMCGKMLHMEKREDTGPHTN